jgi:hypothetical protein
MLLLKLIVVWFLKYLSCVPLLIVSFPLVVILVQFEKNNRLPKFFRWFETLNDDLTGGNAWKRDVPDYNRKWRKIQWLWRNPINTYGYEVLGVLPGNLVYIMGDTKTANKPEGHSGSVLILCDNCFMFYFVRQYWNTSQCIRILLGHKLFCFQDNRDPVRKVKQLAFGINILMDYDKEGYKTPA